MKIPKFVPKVSRPWNPAYKPVWDGMTDNEKRWSTIIDISVIYCALLVIMMFMAIF